VVAEKAAVPAPEQQMDRSEIAGSVPSGPLADGPLDRSGSGRERPRDILNARWLRSRHARCCWFRRWGEDRMMTSNGHPSGARISEHPAPDRVTGGRPLAPNGTVHWRRLFVSDRKRLSSLSRRLILSPGRTAVGRAEEDDKQEIEVRVVGLRLTRSLTNRLTNKRNRYSKGCFRRNPFLIWIMCHWRADQQPSS
jgi:hypothetical protein